MRRIFRTTIIHQIGLSFFGVFPASLAFSQAALPPSYPVNSGGQLNAAPATNSPQNTANPAQNQPASPWNQPVKSFIDPRSGIIYDRFIETVNLPATRMEMEQRVERRFVPEIQTQAVPQTITENVPTVTYVLTQSGPSIWRPFNQQPTYQYVPKVEYVPVSRTVNTMVSVQKYVEKDVPVQVPKLVQITESRQTYVDRPRAGQNLNGLASNYPTTPIATAPAYAPPVYGRSLQPQYASPVIAPPAAYQAAVPAGQYATAGQPLQNPPLVPIQNVAYGTALPTTVPQSPWPKWLTSNGPFFKTSLFRENQLLPANAYANNPALAAVGSPSTGFGGPIGYAYQPAPSSIAGAFANSLPSSNVFPQTNVVPQANVMPTQTPAGRLSIQPTSSSYLSRTAAQVGMPATELR